MTATPNPAPDRPPAHWTGTGKLEGWPASWILGIGIAMVYLANGREIGAFDTIPSTLLPLAILRGDGWHLDRFRPLLQVWGGRYRHS